MTSVLNSLPHWFVRSLCLVLSLSLSFQPTLAAELPKHQPSFPDQAFEGIKHFPRPAVADERAWADYLKSELEAHEKTNFEKVTETGEDLVDLLLRYKDFYAESRRKIDAEIAVVGKDHFFQERLEKKLVKYTDADLGTLEFSNVDGDPVAKIVHPTSGVSFVIFDEDRVSRTSRHFKQYIARQHFDAGSSRKDRRYFDEKGKKRKVKIGRDVIALSIKTAPENSEIQISGVEVAPRVHSVKQWWNATYKRPGKKDTIQGVVSGVAQFFSTWAIAEAVSWFLPGYIPGEAPLMVAGFTLAYGTLLGIWNSTYQNWRSRGPQWRRYMKEGSVSLSYYLGVSVITAAGSQAFTLHDLSLDPSQLVAMADWVFATLNNLSPEQIGTKAANLVSAVQAEPLIAAAVAHPFHNFLANLEFKNLSYYMQRIPEIERRDLGRVPLKIPKFRRNSETGKIEVNFQTWKTPLNQRYWNRQFKYYLPVNWTKFLDQIWFTTTIGPAMQGEYAWWVPLLSVAGFWALIYSSVKKINTWSYDQHQAAAEELKIREGTSRYYSQYYKEKWDKLKSVPRVCVDLLKGKSTADAQ